MLNKAILLLAIFTASFVATKTHATENKQPPSPQLVSHVGLLNELSSRRQTSRFFAVQKTAITLGLSKHFVNVGSGQLSFQIRDLVTVGRRPLVLSRVYDSSLVGGADFGDGWQLSLAETIKVLDDGTLLYRDDTATLNRFVPTTVGFKIDPAKNSDIKSVMFNGEGLLQISYLTGWVKRFEKIGGKHRLASITDNNINSLSLVYHETQLVEVVGTNGRKVDIKRDEKGRIANITDNNNRVVQYHYNQKGQLEAVDDLGGNRTQYQYHGNGLLHKVTDPEGQLAAKFRFGKDNKATLVKVRARKLRYKYKGSQTLVTDESGQTTVFKQNKKGVTTSVTTATGFTSRIVLNERNQIDELWHQEQGQKDELQTKIVYDDNGRPFRYDINGKPTQMERELQQHSYQYDDAGRLLSIGDTEFTYDARGNLTQHKTDKFVHTYQYADNGDVLSESTSLMGLAATTTNYAYNNDGQLTRIKTNNQTSKFEYNLIGKLSKVTFPDGVSHSYQYDKLGFRKHTKRGDTSAVDYFYDKVGNLKETKKYQPGAAIGHSNKITLNANNQVMVVTGEGQTPMTIKYTAKGNPSTISKGENSTEYQYDNLGRLTTVNDSQTGQVNYTYQKGEEGIRLQLDDRTKAAKSNRTQVTAHNQTQAQLQYARMTGSPWQSVIWHESLNKLLVPLPSEINAPDTGYQSAKQRRRLRDAKSIVKSKQLEHDKASNSQFTPSEYNVVNCHLGDDGEAGGVNQDCYLHGVLLDDASTIKVGIPYTFSAFAVAGSECEPTYSFAIDGVVRGLSDSGYFTHTFAQSGSHTVQSNAQCSRCSGYAVWDAMSVNVKAQYKLVTQTIAELPSNKSRDIIGVAEQVTLDIENADLPIQWSLICSSLTNCGSLVNTHTGGVFFTAPDRATTVLITGKIGNQTLTANFKIIEPSGTLYIARPQTNIYHEHGRPSAGRLADIYLLPDTVSFANIKMQESVTLGYGTGYLLNMHLTPHYAGEILRADGGWTQGFGTKVSGADLILLKTDGHLDYSDGTFEWNIPHIFYGSDGLPKQYSTSTFFAQTDDTGKVSISKGGDGAPYITFSAALLCPTTTLNGPAYVCPL
ncbi:MAG: RHS repeat protein [Algicola sp.]|nr:RHS repeat protein [Algicola sp.]